MPLTSPHIHIVIVVQLNGFISSSLLRQCPLYKPPTFHLDHVQYCGDKRLWSLCIQNCAKWTLFSNPVTYRDLGKRSASHVSVLCPSDSTWISGSLPPPDLYHHLVEDFYTDWWVLCYVINQGGAHAHFILHRRVRYSWHIWDSP